MAERRLSLQEITSILGRAEIGDDRFITTGNTGRFIKNVPEGGIAPSGTLDLTLPGKVRQSAPKLSQAPSGMSADEAAVRGLRIAAAKTAREERAEEALSIFESPKARQGRSMADILKSLRLEDIETSKGEDTEETGTMDFLKGLLPEAAQSTPGPIGIGLRFLLGNREATQSEQSKAEQLEDQEDLQRKQATDSGSIKLNEQVKRQFLSLDAAQGSGLPTGTVVDVWDQGSQQFRKAVID